MAQKIILPGQNIKIDLPDAVDPVWYEKLSQIAALANNSNLAALAAAGGYSEGVWTPVFTFGVPGNLNIVYSVQNAKWTKIGRLVSASFIIITSTFTHTTASGNAQITGLPFPSNIDVNYRSMSAVFYQGITKAGYTGFFASIPGASSIIGLNASASGQPLALCQAPDFPTGGTLILSGTLNYIV